MPGTPLFMEFNLVFVLAAIGFAMVLEGVVYFAFANQLPAMFRFLLAAGPGALRLSGFVLMLLGVIIIWAVTTYPSFF